MTRRDSFKTLFGVVVFAALSFWTQPAWADSIQVTFTGQIYFTFDQTFGGPSFNGIQVGNSFSAVLTYDLSQPNLGSTNEGLYGAYNFTVTVQTANGPVTLGQPVSWSPSCVGCAFNPLQVNNDFDTGSGSVDLVHNAGSDVAFVLQNSTLSSLSSGNLADIDWQGLFASSTDPRIFLRAPNAAVVVEGSIDSLSVQTIPSPVPEPSTLFLLASGFGLLLVFRHRLTSAPSQPRPVSVEGKGWDHE